MITQIAHCDPLCALVAAHACHAPNECHIQPLYVCAPDLDPFLGPNLDSLTRFRSHSLMYTLHYGRVEPRNTWTSAPFKVWPQFWTQTVNLVGIF